MKVPVQRRRRRDGARERVGRKSAGIVAESLMVPLSSNTCPVALPVASLTASNPKPVVSVPEIVSFDCPAKFPVGG